MRKGRWWPQQQYQGNWNNTAVYVNWTTATLTTMGNQISSISIVSTNNINNFLGIDNLQFCTAPTIDSVEMTQAIQQIQTLA